eukprot:TRINITY_DN3451_c0_g1_i3.p1 TRINITY_DN3451_c0_g1~~TRINITY_DN3451_c0_g1_i3.p1  ORF type:complete len:848 (+),score=202.08 TRINITY_DN3451_c0_g1_i3:75-2546(+)
MDISPDKSAGAAGSNSPSLERTASSLRRGSLPIDTAPLVEGITPMRRGSLAIDSPTAPGLRHTSSQALRRKLFEVAERTFSPERTTPKSIDSPPTATSKSGLQSLRNAVLQRQGSLALSPQSVPGENSPKSVTDLTASPKFGLRATILQRQGSFVAIQTSPSPETTPKIIPKAAAIQQVVPSVRSLSPIGEEEESGIFLTGVNIVEQPKPVHSAHLLQPDLQSPLLKAQSPVSLATTASLDVDDHQAHQDLPMQVSDLAVPPSQPHDTSPESPPKPAPKQLKTAKPEPARAVVAMPDTFATPQLLTPQQARSNALFTRRTARPVQALPFSPTLTEKRDLNRSLANTTPLVVSGASVSPKKPVPDVVPDSPVPMERLSSRWASLGLTSFTMPALRGSSPQKRSASAKRPSSSPSKARASSPNKDLAASATSKTGKARPHSAVVPTNTGPHNRIPLRATSAPRQVPSPAKKRPTTSQSDLVSRPVAGPVHIDDVMPSQRRPSSSPAKIRQRVHRLLSVEISQAEGVIARQLQRAAAALERRTKDRQARGVIPPPLPLPLQRRKSVAVSLVVPPVPAKQSLPVEAPPPGIELLPEPLRTPKMPDSPDAFHGQTGPNSMISKRPGRTSASRAAPRSNVLNTIGIGAQPFTGSPSPLMELQQWEEDFQLAAELNSGMSTRKKRTQPLNLVRSTLLEDQTTNISFEKAMSKSHFGAGTGILDNKRCLIASDVEFNRLLVEQQLSGVGLLIETCNSVANAMQRLHDAAVGKRPPVDIVVVDMQQASSSLLLASSIQKEPAFQFMAIVLLFASGMGQTQSELQQEASQLGM